MRPDPIRENVAIAGISFSGCFRDPGVPLGTMAVRACVEAVADAGLSLRDIDGFSTYDLPIREPGVAGVSSISSEYMIEALGLPGVAWYSDRGMNVPPGLGAVSSAIIAVAAGMCEVALVCSTSWRPKDRGYALVDQHQALGEDAFRTPYGYGVMPQMWAHWWQRYMYEFGATHEQLGTFIIDNRDNYLLSDTPGVAPKKPLTMDEYLSSRWIARPMRLLDCDWPCDNAGAVVVTTTERARDLRQQPVYVMAVGGGTGPRHSFEWWDDCTEHSGHYVARGLWDKAGMRPSDIDFAMLYDGFSPFILYWLEALGFVGRGEAAPFVAGGALRFDGALPATPNGGVLNEGRSLSMGHLIEGVRQLRGQAGARQLARHRTTVVTGGGDQYSNAVVLRADA
jgi:acetyl-CoA acetyltransferase